MITKRPRNATAQAPATRSISAGNSITAGIINRNARKSENQNMQGLTASQKAFVRQITSNIRKHTSITAATNTSNIMARPDFLELLPMFVQKLLVLDVFGSVL